mmetsp:Transcript_6456/g.10328  ORF Transcript_6456/g.10328 Transcript_6456/m.10328 type:complete len:91 (-) Transcript_6456:125-397(-)
MILNLEQYVTNVPRDKLKMLEKTEKNCELITIPLDLGFAQVPHRLFIKMGHRDEPSMRLPSSLSVSKEGLDLGTSASLRVWCQRHKLEEM